MSESVEEIVELEDKVLIGLGLMLSGIFVALAQP